MIGHSIGLPKRYSSFIDPSESPFIKSNMIQSTPLGTKSRLLRFVRLGISVGVVGLWIAAALVMVMAFGRIARVAHEILAGVTGFSQELELIGIVDILLLAIGIIIISTGIVSLMIRPLDLPKGLRMNDLHQLKSTFSSFLILIMAILYLESLSSLRDIERSTRTNPSALLYGGIGFLAVTIGLIVFQRSGHHQPGHSRGENLPQAD